jgi:prepilin-type N-terminal cleavage/methylation domain-containing protein
MPRGFTLVELLVVLAILGVLAMMAIGIFGNLIPDSQLGVQADGVVSLLRTAQAKSIDGYADDVWGVHLTATEAIQFKGNDYLGRDTAYDEVLEFSEPLSVSGLTEIMFEARTGATLNTGTITLTSSVVPESIVLTVNANGRVER